MPDRDRSGLVWWWNEAKDFVEHSLAFSNDAIHVLVSVLLLLVAAAVLRKPITSWIPWLVVLLFAILNEASDLWIQQWPEPGRQYGEGVKDIVLTMLLPTALLFSARKLPRLYGRTDRGER